MATSPAASRVMQAFKTLDGFLYVISTRRASAQKFGYRHAKARQDSTRVQADFLLFTVCLRVSPQTEASAQKLVDHENYYRTPDPFLLKKHGDVFLDWVDDQK